MRVLQIINCFGLEYGGSSEVCYQISKALMLRGHTVKIVSPIKGTLPEGSEKFYLNQLPSKEYEIVHMHNYRNYSNILGWSYSIHYNIPYLLQAHGSIGTFFSKGFRKRIFDLVIGKQILRGEYRGIAISKDEYNQYLNMGVKENKVRLLFNAIDLSQFKEMPKRGLFRDKYSIPQTAKLVLYLGRIHWIKGLDLLIESFSKLPTDTYLAIVGQDDGYLKTVESLIDRYNIRDRVRLTGGLFGKNKLEAFIDADVNVLFSSYEVFSVGVLEACACGCPVVVSNNCGNVEWLDGAVYPVRRNVYDIVNTTNKVLYNKDVSASLSHKAVNIIKEFTWNKVAEKLELIYK